MSSEQTSENMQKLIKFDRLKFSASEDNMMLKQIEATHEPDGREFDVKPLLHLVEQIFTCATPKSDVTFDSLGLKTNDVEALEDNTHQAGFISTLEALAYTIDRISCEIRCKCSGREEAHRRAISVLNMVSSHPWDAKLVLILSAFAVNYGEFWLVFQSYNSNELAKSMAILKQVPEILGRSSTLKPQFNSIKDLIKAMLDVANCIVKFRELPSQYITADVSAFSTALANIPIAVYWTIRCVVACASQIARLRGLQGDEHPLSTSEAWEISALVHKVSNIHNHLRDKLDACHKHIDDKRHMEAYQMLLELFMTSHSDNMKVLKALIYARDNQNPLFHGATHRRVDIDVFKDTHVLLLISNLDISHDELEVLEDIYRESLKKRPGIQYEIVWLPIIDQSDPWMESSQKLFENHRARMPWYTRHDPLRSPSPEDGAVITFIKKEWHYGRKPILVVLGPRGQVVCQNALHMMWIWKDEAFPFTTSREEDLWKEATWKLDLLVDGIDPRISEWIAAGKIICLYGGDDIEWIQRFTTIAKKVAESAGISLEMVYVGKSNPKELVHTNIKTIIEDELSHHLKGLTSIWYFWVRIESMLYSKIRLGQTVEKDPTMREILKMLSFNNSHEGWALLSKGSEEITKAKGDLFLTCLRQYNQWEVHVRQKGFLQALKDHLLQIHPPHHCNQFELLVAAGMIPETLVCSECGRKMEKFFVYRCCDV
ncbi:hypothetical protein PVL29_019070 [Vitis rotundifolia]|uniref:Protein SIEVE ELEMENT OCCLUSION B n=3 Tax=Vitis rotundifolia TaxID=103349 RepID=A0AA38Z6H7_VITRO|nr:hypothetical protein PVL29_019070 [Vitis rotundifolia]